MQRTIEVTGPATVTDAWERYAVIAAWRGWSAPIRSVDSSATRIAPGVTGVVRGPAGILVPFVVEAVDELARSWRWRVAAGPVTVGLTHTVRPVEGGSGSVTGLTVDGPPPVALVYPEIARLSLHRLVALEG